MQFMRLFSLKLGKNRKRVRALYVSVLGAALNPELYVGQFAEDTFNGRFEQVSLHGALLARHLRRRGADGQRDAALLYDEILSGFDHAYRETGVGDSSIARKVRALGEQFFGLSRGLVLALESQEDEALAGFVQRNQLGRQDPAAFISYLRRVDNGLRDQFNNYDGPDGICWPKPDADGF